MTYESAMSLVTRAFTVPAADTAAFAGLREESKSAVLHMLTVLSDLADLRRSGMSLHKATLTLEARSGIHHTKLRRAAEGWEREGWRTLIDRRLESQLWQTEERTRLPEPMLEHWRRLCETYQASRGNKAAWRALMRQLDAWRRGYGPAIPGYGTPPPNCPNGDHPEGWSYCNLNRHAPSKICLVASRVGREAAQALLPGVITTRVGLYPGQFIQFDDVWHNFLVNHMGYRKPVRMLEFRAVDVASACTPSMGHKPRLPGSEGNKTLNGNDFRGFLAGYLYSVGWSRRGTELCLENGTATVAQALIDRIEALTGGVVTVRKGAIHNDQLLPGKESGRGKGNPRFKALLEGGNALIQREMSWLPGQVGMGRDDCPEELHGLVKLNDRYADLLAANDELAAQLRLPFVTYDVACAAIRTCYERVNARTDHELEGWQGCGYISAQIRMSVDAPWTDLDTVRSQDPDMAEFMVARLANRPELYRLTKLSPQQVWDRAAQDFERLPLHLVPEILGLEAARVVTVHAKHTFDFEDASIGPGIQHYHAIVDGQLLTPGREYLAHPWGDKLLLLDRDSGAWLGACNQPIISNRADTERLRASVAEAKRVEVAALHPAMERSKATLSRRIEDSLHNAAIAREAEARRPAAALDRTLRQASRRLGADAMQDLCTAQAEQAATSIIEPPALDLSAISQGQTSQHVATDYDITDLFNS